MCSKFTYIINNLHLYRKEDIPRLWYKCFEYFLIDSIKKETIDDLFEYCTFSNWSDLHLENTSFANDSKDELLEHLIFEIRYISDRYTWDRIFRVHWLFHCWIRLEFDYHLFKVNQDGNIISMFTYFNIKY